MLDMEEFAEAIVGVPGEGLNVEQRKLLTIGVELAAKPALLLFLDEPTSGLDSQSSWAIVGFLRKLANSGQAILSTIHQPSSILFQEFDNLLFLAKGGRTVYFGPIGPNSETLLQYFEKHGAMPCAEQENPAEYILEAVTLGASGQTGHDWPVIWKSSDEIENMTKKLEQIHHETRLIEMKDDSGDTDEFAMPLFTQIRCCTTRIFQQYWRTPSYIWGKVILGLASALYGLRSIVECTSQLIACRFIGFSFFHSNNSLQGMQNVVFSLFMLTSILSSMVQQVCLLSVRAPGLTDKIRLCRDS
jgi:ATP-binding cassette subfamily G (WHITE) protein 2 (PDR)